MKQKDGLQEELGGLSGGSYRTAAPGAAGAGAARARVAAAAGAGAARARGGSGSARCSHLEKLAAAGKDLLGFLGPETAARSGESGGKRG